ncbi:MAG TPA: hypothetical protein VJA47_03960 [archaeon]|nr:hypothetical protein [archaeon]
MVKKKSNHKMYLGIISALVIVIVILSTVIVQNSGTRLPAQQSQLVSTDSDIKTTSQAKAASDETLTSISEIKTLLDDVKGTLEEK